MGATMQRIMGMTAALMLASTATAAMAGTVDVEQLKLRPETFVRQTVAIDGIVFGAGRESASVHFDAGRLKSGMITIDWADRGEPWQRAQYDCADEIDEKCRAIVTGTVRARRFQADTYFIEKAKVEFTAAK